MRARTEGDEDAVRSEVARVRVDARVVDRAVVVVRDKRRCGQIIHAELHLFFFEVAPTPSKESGYRGDC